MIDFQDHVARLQFRLGRFRTRINRVTSAPWTFAGMPDCRRVARSRSATSTPSERIGIAFRRFAAGAGAAPRAGPAAIPPAFAFSRFSSPSRITFNVILVFAGVCETQRRKLAAVRNLLAVQLRHHVIALDAGLFRRAARA